MCRTWFPHRGQSWVEFLVPLWACRAGDGSRDADAQVGCGNH